MTYNEWGYKTAISNFENCNFCSKISKIFNNFFFFFKIFPLKIKIFKKTYYILEGQWLMNMCTTFQVDIFKNG